MAHCHDFTVAVGTVTPGVYLKGTGKRCGVDNQRMITCYLIALRQVSEQACAAMK